VAALVVERAQLTRREGSRFCATGATLTFPVGMKTPTFLLVMSLAASAQAQVCELPTLQTLSGRYGWYGIGDGCSTSFARFALPPIGAFRSLFTPACDGHDRCLVTIGAGARDCNDAFLGDLRRACDDAYAWYQPERALCRDAANQYYAAVEVAVSSEDPTWGLQAGMEAEARALAHQVNTDQCGLSVEAASAFLLTSARAAEIRQAFQAARGRAPTIYEFLAAASAPGIVRDVSAWRASLANAALSAPATVPPVAFTRTLTGYTIAPPRPLTASYVWSLQGFPRTVGPSITIYDYEVDPEIPSFFIPTRGFLKVTQGGVSNQLVIDTRFRVAGRCMGCEVP
jgi:hypothetical protein